MSMSEFKVFLPCKVSRSYTHAAACGAKHCVVLRLVNGALYYYTFVSGLSGSSRSVYITVTGDWRVGPDRISSVLRNLLKVRVNEETTVVTPVLQRVARCSSRHCDDVPAAFVDDFLPKAATGQHQ